jgi:hypothetical protein
MHGLHGESEDQQERHVTPVLEQRPATLFQCRIHHFQKVIGFVDAPELAKHSRTPSLPSPIAEQSHNRALRSVHRRPAAAPLAGAAGTRIVQLTELAAFESGSHERLTKPGSTLQNHPAIH